LDQVDAKESETGFRRSERLPQLDGTVFARSGLPGGNPTRNWSIGARIDLDWSVLAGAERARYRQSLADLNAAKARSSAAVSEVRHQIERIVQAHVAAQDEILVAVDLARVERMRLTSVQQAAKIGSQNLTELDAARTDWLNAVHAAWQAFYGAKSLEAELETWTGIGPARRGWIWEER
jgi:outer membrane protein TolC